MHEKLQPTGKITITHTVGGFPITYGNNESRSPKETKLDKLMRKILRVPDPSTSSRNK